jgi:hypothetical protein
VSTKVDRAGNDYPLQYKFSSAFLRTVARRFQPPVKYGRRVRRLRLRVVRVRAAKRVRPALTTLFLAVFVAVSLLSDAFQGETNRAIGVFTSEDIEVVRDYILCYGAWTPLISDAYGLAGYSGVSTVLHTGLRQRLALGAF